MITDAIVEAMDMLVDLIANKQKKAGALSIREMLCDFAEENWAPMSEEERTEWLEQFLP